MAVAQLPLPIIPISFFSILQTYEIRKKRGAFFICTPLRVKSTYIKAYFFSSNNFSLVTTFTNEPSFKVLLTIL